MSFTLAQLSEGLEMNPNRGTDNRLVDKWSKYGLLEGLGSQAKQKMARLLENQAGEMLRNPQVLMEANALSLGGGGLASSGQVAGFISIAFPIVRRLFAGLISNELVSVQPMSLPSGLIFYMDYSYGSNNGGNAGLALSDSATAATYKKGQSVFGNPSGADVRFGASAAGGMYDNVGTGYSKVHKSSTAVVVPDIGAFGAAGTTWTSGDTVASAAEFVGLNARWADYDSTVETAVATNTLDYCFAFCSASEVLTKIPGADLRAVDQLAIFGYTTTNGGTNWGDSFQGGLNVKNLRKLNQRGNWNYLTSTFTPDNLAGSHVLFVLAVSNTGAVPAGPVSMSAAIADVLAVNTDGSALTIPSFESDFATPPSPAIPEVEIKIESTAVTAQSRKLRARWSPEMAQDLSAFYSMDVEAELTNIISEMVTLEIDREILNQLVLEATAARYYWSRAPGKFVNKQTGAEALRSTTLAPGPQFTGTVREWYETLVETIIDVANEIHRKTLRGSGNFIVCGPDVSTLLEATQGYKANYKVDGNGQVSDQMAVGAESVGSIANRFTVYRDPYFPRNKVLVGLKGSGFLESGFVFAPYIPLILTPTVYDTEQFTPRRGLMTRVGMKMVRADFYGVITVLDLNII
jgi:hypothetical protein